MHDSVSKNTQKIILMPKICFQEPGSWIQAQEQALPGPSSSSSLALCANFKSQAPIIIIVGRPTVCPMTFRHLQKRHTT